MITREQLEKMKNVDPRTVDRSTLVDIETVKIDRELAKEERIKAYLEQIGNPYCYLHNGMAVKVSFSGKETLEEILAKCTGQPL